MAFDSRIHRPKGSLRFGRESWLGLVQALANDSGARVHWGIDRFHARSGVMQGCVLAAAQVRCAMDWLLGRLLANTEITAGSTSFTSLDYADGGVLFAQDSGDLKDAAESFQHKAAALGLKVSGRNQKNPSPSVQKA